MKILVTGGSGFIGSHLAEELLVRGEYVRVLDRHPPRVKGVEWCDGDLRWVADCYKATIDIDNVYHLAARISVDESLEFSWHYFNDNYMSTVNILNACRQNNIKKFLFMSSCEVYGNIEKGLVNETYPCNPTSPYAASKYAGERAAIAFCKSFNIPLTVIRPFNIFGEGQKPFRAGSLIPTLIILAMQGKDLTIHGTGKQSRDYLYAKDVVSALILAMEHKHEYNCEIYNLSSGITRDVNEIATKILRLTESKSVIRYVTDPRGMSQILRSAGCSEKASRVLGWKPKHDFDEVLKGVVKFYKEGYRYQS